MTDDRKARVTREMELLGPEAMTRSLRAFPRIPLSERVNRRRAGACVIGFAGQTSSEMTVNDGYNAMKIYGIHTGQLESMYEHGDADLLHTWILEWLELNRVAAPVPIAAPVPPIAVDCPRCCQVEAGTTRHCADHCEEGMPF